MFVKRLRVVHAPEAWSKVYLFVPLFWLFYSKVCIVCLDHSQD